MDGMEQVAITSLPEIASVLMPDCKPPRLAFIFFDLILNYITTELTRQINVVEMLCRYIISC